jgi:hypothetical protein
MLSRARLTRRELPRWAPPEPSRGSLDRKAAGSPEGRPGAGRGFDTAGRRRGQPPRPCGALLQGDLPLHARGERARRDAERPRSAVPVRWRSRSPGTTAASEYTKLSQQKRFSLEVPQHHRTVPNQDQIAAGSDRCHWLGLGSVITGELVAAKNRTQRKVVRRQAYPQTSPSVRVPSKASRRVRIRRIAQAAESSTRQCPVRVRRNV